MAQYAFTLHQHDLPANLDLGARVAVDTETTGLKFHRDRLCLVQLCGEDGHCHLIKVAQDVKPAPNLVRLLRDESCQKLFHFGRFDLAMLMKHYGVVFQAVYCTKIASKLARTNTDQHGLSDLIWDLLMVRLEKSATHSDWAVEEKSPEQLSYACEDVIYLHRLQKRLNFILQREGRTQLAEAAFAHLPARAAMDLAGFD
ncbi:MAG: ribonuclease D, partial [Alphaproteobacteria bacterium]|nr:ribonuclease D [Alphaproteobacteria bacterium]